MTKTSTSQCLDPSIDKFVKCNYTCLPCEFELDTTSLYRNDHVKHAKEQAEYDKNVTFACDLLSDYSSSQMPSNICDS